MAITKVTRNMLTTGIVDNSNATAITIDSSENVGIGTTSPQQKLHISSGGLQIDGNIATPASGQTGLMFDYYQGASRYWSRGADATTRGTHGFYSLENDGGNQITSMFIDSSGDVIIGGTSSGANDAVSLSNTGYIQAIVNGDTVAYFNRRTSDGEIARFQKDGSTVGSIGTSSSDLTIYSTTASHVGLQFGNTRLHPTDNAGSTTDGVADLGFSNTRWKDLYISGGAYLGGTAAANKLDDYEEGSFTPVFTIGSGSVSYTKNEGSYTKVGGVVNIVIAFQLSGISSPSGANLSIAGLPFNAGAGEKFVASVTFGLIRSLTNAFDNLRGYINNDASTITISDNSTSGSYSGINANTLQATTLFYVSATYNTDE